MAVKPVKFISDVQTRKQIIKTDVSGNVLFAVSGTLPAGSVSSSLPITASALYIDGNAEIIGTLNAKRMHITEVTTSVYYQDSLSASINALQDVSASNAAIGDVLQWNGTNWIAGSGGTSEVNARFAIIANLSEAITGTFDPDGNKNVQLNNYKASDLDCVMVDVMVRYGDSTTWKNDLISIELSGNAVTDKLHVLLSAPVLTTTDKYKIFVHKQTGSL